MLKRTVIPTIYNGSKNNGNWELSMIEAMMGVAVFTEDLSLLQHAQNMWKERIPAYFYSFSLDGNKPAPFPVNRATSNGWNGQLIFDATTDGVLQETCSDFQHAEMGFSAAINAAETDYIQQSYSAALYNASDSAQRIITGANVLSGLEQAASTTAPMNFCTGRDGKLVLEGIATFAMAYNHYHNRMHDSRMADLSGTTGLRGTGNTYRWIQQGVITQNFYSDSGAKMVILEPLTHYDQPEVDLPAYSLSMNPNVISIAPGQSGKSQITLTSNSEYNRVVSLKLASQIPTGVSATLSTTQISPQSPQAELQISTSSTTAASNTIISVLGDDGNKQFTTSTRLVITPVEKTVTVYANNAKVDYLQPLPALSYSAQPDVAFTIKPGCSTTALPKSLPGAYPIRCTGAQLAGYRISYVDGILSILPLKGIITARNVSIKFGTPIPTVLRYSRRPSVALTKEPVCTTTATNTSPAGRYPITCRGAEAVGYVYDYVNATLTIRP